MNLTNNVKETDILINKPKREKPEIVHTPENTAAVEESIREAPSTSICRRSQQLNISKTSLRRTLHKSRGMMPYKVQLVQGLKEIDHTIRFRFAKWAYHRLTEDANKNKVHFDLAGYIKNKIFAFGAQKIRTHTLKSRRTKNE